MKKISKYLVCIFILVILIILIKYSKYDNKKTVEVVNYNTEKRGVFFSYIELKNYIKNDDPELMKKNIDSVIANVKSINFNLIILQVRSFSDAIYKSDIYPYSSVISKEEGLENLDILKYFIEKAHQENILIYGWINPYRVRTTEDINSISKKNPAYKYIETDTLYVGNGIYYNPSKTEVTDLIVSGVKEIITNYQVDGIIFDDYFYPNNEIDIADYQEYLQKNKYVSLEEYHLNIINQLVKKVHAICLAEKIEFGISPDGNIENNYTKNFADVKTWLKSDEYIDFIMPQIYYGFLNEVKPFYQTLLEWNDLIKGDIKMIVALAFYKVGLLDQYAKSGSKEWINNNDIIMREIILSRSMKNYAGFALFRYGNLFDNKLFTETSILEKKNMCKVIK